MGNISSKSNVPTAIIADENGNEITLDENRRSRFWTPLTFPNSRSKRKIRIQTDFNKNLLSPQIPVNVTPTTPIVPPTATSSYQGFRTLHFIKSQLSRLFTSRSGQRKCSAIEEIDMPSLSEYNASSHIIRPAFGHEASKDSFKIENIFARPVTPEMVGIYHATISPNAFPSKLQQPSRTQTQIKITPKTVPSRNKNNATSDSDTGGGGRHNISTANGSPTNSTRNWTRPQTTGEAKTRSARTVKKREPLGKRGCCGVVAPPVYLGYSSTCGSGSGNVSSRRCGKGNPIIDRLKNVDVVEELQYHVPEGGNAGDCNENSQDEDFDYFYLCNECGEMEPCKNPNNGKKSGGKKTNPVIYSRRQRFNFAGAKGSANDEDDDGPPFKWPGGMCCTCPCCRAGLRRNPNCECKCCQGRGQARVVNSFDEIPVGKNPESKPQKACICDDEDASPAEDAECEELLPKDSGVYFYNAEEKKFIRQVPRTPTPLIIQHPPQSRTPTHSLLNCDDICQVLQCLPPKRNKTRCAPEPIVMPPIYGGCYDMQAVLANAEMALKGGIVNCEMQTTQTTIKNPVARRQMDKINNNIPSTSTSTKSPESSNSSSKVSPPVVSVTQITQQKKSSTMSEATSDSK